MSHNYQELHRILYSHYEVSEAAIMYQMLLEYLTNRESLSISVMNRIISDLEQQRPIQYIIGKSYFADFEIQVREGVLIPRPETDELVQWIKQYIKQTNPVAKIWDIGTGSGCIALALKRKYPNLLVYASDISEEALQIAEQNGQDLQLDIHFFQDDILCGNHRNDVPMMDIMVSNPPYILKEESASIEKHVKCFEPHQALFVTNEDPLQFYKAIELAAASHLVHNGALFLELHSLYAAETQSYFEDKGWQTILKRDMQGKSRMLQCVKKIS